MADLHLSDIQEGKPIAFTKNGKALCVARVGNEVFAIEDNCTHQDASLSEGTQDGFKIECWLHSAEFDVRSGEALTPPAVTPVKTFPVKISNNEIEIEA